MKITVDKTKCIGCGACVSKAVENFGFDDDGFCEVISDIITEDTMDAVETCPFQAITIEEDKKEVISIDKSKCLGCGACVLTAPDNFAFDDNGEPTVIDQTLTEDAKNAINSCPVQAITTNEKE